MSFNILVVQTSCYKYCLANLWGFNFLVETKKCFLRWQWCFLHLDNRKKTLRLSKLRQPRFDHCQRSFLAYFFYLCKTEKQLQKLKLWQRKKSGKKAK